jgi:hypothetical protein
MVAGVALIVAAVAVTVIGLAVSAAGRARPSHARLTEFAVRHPLAAAAVPVDAFGGLLAAGVAAGFLWVLTAVHRARLARRRRLARSVQLP